MAPHAFAEACRFAGHVAASAQVPAAEFDQILDAAYQHDAGTAQKFAEDAEESLSLERIADSVETGDLLAQEDDAPVIRLINALLMEALRENASDIHIETFERSLIVRLRVDGVLREALRLQPTLAPVLVSRIKVMARLDIAEKRLPQDGRISLRVGGNEMDVRVSTMPAGLGERVVLRLLQKNAGRFDLEQLGLPAEYLEKLHAMIGKPHGIVLITGPTGSGKTTTLYGMLSKLNDRSRNILTIEDPIEYQIEGIGQTQVNTKVDLTFARGLRAILRQDPDVVMVGEIRDVETARIAVQASLTGHLVLSTLHTNSAIGAVTRLLDMGVESFLLSSSLVGLLSQRLVRTLCPACKEPYTASAAECEFLGVGGKKKAPTLHRAKGCDACRGTGYKGRMGIYEIISVDDKLRGMIHANEGEQALEAYARQLSPGIREEGRSKVLQGLTTVEEIMRVTSE
ncbi:MAG: type II secretion system protein GspE [Alphaproteobacteria bacterium]|nr:type II secretion system protein GspE [Alphaproteobacteria bacterium]